MKREMTERQKKMMRNLNLGFYAFCLAMGSLVIGILFGSRTIMTIWMENEAYHVNNKAEIYKEFGEIEKADSVLKIHDLRDSVINSKFLSWVLIKK